MENKANIKEIFSSIQGEGPFIGFRQIFVRFSGCNLKCSYCDTPFEPEKFCRLRKNISGSDCATFANPISPEELDGITKSYLYSANHSISLTGGEPLLHYEFLKEYLPLINKKIMVYLETNGTLPEQYAEIIDLIDFTAMDVKLGSSTGQETDWEKHRRFLNVALSKNKNIFIKIVVTSKITDNEVAQIADLVGFNNIEVILQPVDSPDKTLLPSNQLLSEIQLKLSQKGIMARIIPQVHKMINVL